MPELPDIAAYITALEARILHQPLERVRLESVFLLRTVDPPLTDVEGRVVREIRRVGKRIAIGVEGDHPPQGQRPIAGDSWLFPPQEQRPVVGDPGMLWLVLHLMIAGRLHWRPPQGKLAGRQSLVAFDFPTGSLILTEAGSKRMASLHILRGEEGLRSVDPGGLEIFSTDLNGFRAALSAVNRTIKRALTDPHLISGVGNSYSDEILHAAQLSPMAMTQKMKPEEWERLFAATRDTLTLWMDRLRGEAEVAFPEKVTAFRPEMAVHGRFGQPCPRCGDKVQRIRYASNETNYCARCQTGGKVLADRGLSRLMGSDWPRTLEGMEALKRR
ncbi:MAG: DNA-formamidopyrimidine glycosylase family protein [Terracidiphilus sp.]|jgi:formamidopyrimidine-DNA glycosylase